MLPLVLWIYDSLFKQRVENDQYLSKKGVEGTCCKPRDSQQDLKVRRPHGLSVPAALGHDVAKSWRRHDREVFVKNFDPLRPSLYVLQAVSSRTTDKSQVTPSEGPAQEQRSR